MIQVPYFFLRSLMLVPLIFLSGFIAEAQNRHPRVAELESLLVKESNDFLRQRFPGMPSITQIRVEPLHREEALKAKSNERLPYSWSEDIEIKDEWDDPNLTLWSLLPRTRKITVHVSVSQKVSAEEVTEIQQALSGLLKLVPGRDEITIDRRGWTTGDTQESDWTSYFILAVFMLVFLLGSYFVLRLNSERMSRALSSLMSKDKGSSGAGAAPPSVTVVTEPSIGKVGRDSGGSVASASTSSDPIKVRELIVHTLEFSFFQQRKVFPTLRDMILLGQLGEEDSKSLGALLSEFSQDHQKTLFSYSWDRVWLQALNDPGELNARVLETLQKMVRLGQREYSMEWEVLLISIWRLGDRRNEFLLGLDRTEAQAILSRFPKSISVETAMSVLPGAWASMLEINAEKGQLRTDRLKELTLQAQKIQPLRNFTLLEQFHQEKDLLDYLKTVEPRQEKEIYLVAAPDSLIHQYRPPFYPALECDEDTARLLIARVGIEKWAMAMFNVVKPERKAIEAAMTEKQHHLYMDRLRKLDALKPPKEQVGVAREYIGQLHKQIKEQAPSRENLRAEPAPGSQQDAA